MAATAAGNTMKQIPQIKLAIAFPLVVGGSSKDCTGDDTNGAAGGATTGDICSAPPQPAQNFPLSGFAAPQRAQNIAAPPKGLDLN
jgi:hypothetical protein